MKKPFVTKEQLEAIAAHYPTPFHIYDEAGIRENARRLRAAFAWNPGYREYFAVKATPTPAILKILKEEGCGCDCSSEAELIMAQRCGFTGEEIMFSSVSGVIYAPCLRMEGITSCVTQRLNCLASGLREPRTRE